MAELVDLKRTTAEIKKDKNLFTAEEADYNRYPLSLYLGKEEIDKLGLAGKKPGDEVVLRLRVHVQGVSSSEDERGGGHNSMTLQVRAGAAEDTQPKSQAERLYGSK